MILTRNDDPRDNLEKMTRDELWHYARENGVSDKFPAGHNTLIIDYTSDARPNMVSILRALGLKGKDMSGRTLGGPPIITEPPKYKAPPEVKETATTPVSEMTIQQLRSECIERGIKVERTDNKATLRDKIIGQ